MYFIINIKENIVEGNNAYPQIDIFEFNGKYLYLFSLNASYS